MHGQPAQAWTLDALARDVGLSRSAFAERFPRILGPPAMQYLGKWRLQLAANLLGRPGMSIARVASDVGSESGAIGRASCRARVWQYVSIYVVGVSLKTKKKPSS